MSAPSAQNFLVTFSSSEDKAGQIEGRKAVVVGKKPGERKQILFRPPYSLFQITMNFLSFLYVCLYE